MIESLQNSYVIVPLLAIVAMFAVLIDSKMQEYEPETKDYVKIAILVAFTAWVVIFINGYDGSATDVITGNPPF
jgi:hypothetical protein